ncbi:MAG: N-acetyltransferase [Solirubrobacteraceae bacterium]|nr:N-acetyltransferase [Solirubrobacteraceae bacterium]
MSEPVLTDDPERHRMELHVGDELLGWAEYLPAGNSVILAHTEVLEGHEGEGLGGKIVRAAFEAVREQGKTVLPTCPFAAAYIRRNPELVEYVDPSLRGQFT